MARDLLPSPKPGGSVSNLESRSSNLKAVNPRISGPFGSYRPDSAELDSVALEEGNSQLRRFSRTGPRRVRPRRILQDRAALAPPKATGCSSCQRTLAARRLNESRRIPQAPWPEAQSAAGSDEPFLSFR